MSITVDGILFYGLCELEEDNWDLKESSDEACPENCDKNCDACKEKWIPRDHYDNMWSEEELTEKFGGARLGIHGDYDLNYIYFTEATAWVKYPKNVSSIIKTEVTPKDIDDMNRLADFLGVPKDKRNFGWWLTILYG